MPRKARSRRPPHTISRRSSAEAEGRAGAAEDAFPAEFRARIAELLGEESKAFFAALADPPTGLRVNTLRVRGEHFREISPFVLTPLTYPEGGFLLEGDGRPGRHPYHAAGLYYLQDPGAMAVAALLDPQPGEWVIDLAAAPGGKTTHLAALMDNTGLLVANDVHPGRTRELTGNLERCGVRNALVTLESVEGLAEHFGAVFDRVLLDAPCSGEAMFSKSEAARRAWSPAAVAGCARRQHGLLAEAARLLRPGGRLVYSTCTFSPEEDEEVVARFLSAHPGFEIEDPDPVPGAAPGRPEWVPHELRTPDLARTRRLWPHRVPGAGHFVARLRRKACEMADEEPDPPHLPAAPVPVSVRRLWENFRESALTADPPGAGTLALRGQELYRMPAAAPPLGRLRVERPGWWLGTVRKDRFEPSHALALGLTPQEVRNAIPLAATGPEVHAYLRGESIRLPVEHSGWVLLVVEGFALGWGKQVGSTVKNHYPKGLRWHR
jgi:NOL1/NOP2/sun family putative RNA methylase